MKQRIDRVFGVFARLLLAIVVGIACTYAILAASQSATLDNDGAADGPFWASSEQGDVWLVIVLAVVAGIGVAVISDRLFVRARRRPRG